MRKKNLIKIMLIALILIGIFVTVSTISLDSFDIRFGKKSYDSSGEVSGCNGRGDECIYVY